MSTRDRVLSAFKSAFSLEGDVDVGSLVYRDHPEWTSIGHMTLVASLETEFDAMIDTDEILAMSSFDKAVEIMSKYAND